MANEVKRRAKQLREQFDLSDKSIEALSVQEQKNILSVPSPEFATIFDGTGTKFAATKDSDLIFEKELIYSGTFTKGSGKDKQEFDIKDADIKHWDKMLQEFSELDIGVPVPLEHTDNPEDRRGTVVPFSSFVKINERGKLALFVKIEFRDKDAAKLALVSDVSIFAVDATSRADRKFKNVITHVAITDYPVVRHLKGFEVLAASHVTKTQTEEKEMSLALAKKLGGPADMADDAAGETFIVSKIKKLESELTELKKNKSKAKEPDDVKKIAASLSDVVVTIERKTRKGRLEMALSKGKITKVVADDLAAKWCSDDKDTMALSVVSDATDNVFDNIMDLFEKNEVIPMDEKTRSQVLKQQEFSENGDNSKGQEAVADLHAQCKAKNG